MRKTFRRWRRWEGGARPAAPAAENSPDGPRGAARVVIATGLAVDGPSREGVHPLPGRHVTDHQMRLYMTFRQTDGPAVSAAKASISTASAYRLEQDHRPPSSQKAVRGRRRPDPLADFFGLLAVRRGWEPAYAGSRRSSFPARR